MTVAEMATYHVSEDPASLAPAGGYVVACMALYERGFGVPSHQFLCSLLWSYGLQLYRLTPSRILHMEALVTLCDANIGIEPHFNLWSYLFHAWLRQGSNTVNLGSVDILAQSRSEVDPYFSILMPDPSVAWWKMWFFLRNDADAPLPTFTCSHPVSPPNWWYSVAHADLHRLQSL
jgi:hypothetical protein